MEDSSCNGHQFRTIPRQLWSANLELDPVLNEKLEQWPHLNELVQCYRADWVKDDGKYGHYESVAPLSFQNQNFEGPDTDIETEMHLANARQSKTGDATDDDVPSTSGRQINEVGSYFSTLKTINKAKGYRVGSVYDDILAMAWFLLELIVKSTASEQSRLLYHNLPLGEDIPPMRLKDGVFRCIMQLYDCLPTEVHER